MRLFAPLCLLPLFLIAASPAAAECTGQGCYSGLGTLLFMAVLILLVLVGTLIFVVIKWRKVGLVIVGLLVAIVALPPVLSNAYLSWKLWQMQAVERSAILPPPGDRRVLLIGPDHEYKCDALCLALLMGAGERGVIALAAQDFEGLDLRGKIDLAALPLEHWGLLDTFARDRGNGNVTVRQLNAQERTAAARDVDYVVILLRRFDLPQNLNLALRQSPALDGLANSAELEEILAPLPDPGQGVLDLVALDPDVLRAAENTRAYVFPFPFAGDTDRRDEYRPEHIAAFLAALCPAVMTRDASDPGAECRAGMADPPWWRSY